MIRYIILDIFTITKKFLKIDPEQVQLLQGTHKQDRQFLTIIESSINYRLS